MKFQNYYLQDVLHSGIKKTTNAYGGATDSERNSNDYMNHEFAEVSFLKAELVNMHTEYRNLVYDEGVPLQNDNCNSVLVISGYSSSTQCNREL